MPSPRNHILDFVIWQRHFLGMPSLRNLSLLLQALLEYPISKLNIRPQQRPNFEFLIWLAIITPLIPKIIIRISAAAAAEF